MEHAFKFESADDFNTRVSKEIESLNLETRGLLMKEAAQTLFSAVDQEAKSVEQFALQKVSRKGPASLTHYIEWGREKNKFIPDDTVSCKLAEIMNKNDSGMGTIYEILFPLNSEVKSARYLLDNFNSLIDANEFYIVKTNTTDPSIARYYYINGTGIAEYEPYGTDSLERAIELAVFMEKPLEFPRKVLTADRELRLLANLADMKLVPYKKSTL